LGITPYGRLIRDNLETAYARPRDELERFAGARWDGDFLIFRAFGHPCRVNRQEVILSDARREDPIGILVSLYLQHALSVGLELDPWKAFKDFSGSMPYQGAFSANSERVMIPYVDRLRKGIDRVKMAFDGADGDMGDVSLILYPLPKIALHYICYLTDEEFPASVTILFSGNARSFMPLDGLADVAEYTSKEIIHLVGG